MNEFTAIVVAAIIFGLGGIVLVWSWTGRPSWSGWVRAVVRFVAVPAFIFLGVGAVALARQSATPGGNAAAQALVPSERMTVALGTLTVTLNATGALTPANQSTLTFPVSAPVTDVMVSLGDRVKAGDILAREDTTALDAQVRNAQISLTDAQNSLAALQAPATDLQIRMAKAQVEAAQASLSSPSLNGPSADDIEIARLNVELAKNSLWQAQVNRDIAAARPGYNTQLNAYSNQITQAAQLAGSDTNVAIAQTNYQATLNKGPDASGLASGNASLLSAQANLDKLMAGPSDSDVRKAQIVIDNAQLAVDTATRNLSQATLVAPFDGVVASLDFVKGTLSSSGSIVLVDTSGYTITLAVDEKDITKLKVGQNVSLQVQAFANASITGKVTRVDPAPVTSTSGQLVTYNVEVTLDKTDQPLRPGMSAIATVTLDQVNNVIVVPNRFLTIDPTTQKATVKIQTAPTTYQDIPVTLGKATDSESEIVSGLTVGQVLVILPKASQTTGTQGFGLFGGGQRPGGNFGGGGGGGGFGGGAPPAGGGGAPPGGG